MHTTRVLASLISLIALAACGGSDSSDPAGTSPADDAPAAEDGTSEPGAADATDDAASNGDGASTTDSLEVLLTVPSTGGLGEGIELSPDGTRLAHATGGLTGEIVVYDLATGAETGRTAAPNTGPVVWTGTDQLVGWSPGPTVESDPSVEVIDAATLVSAGPAAATYPDGFVSCDLPFDFDHTVDVSSGAVFAIGPVDGGTQICRLDTATLTVSGVVAPTTGSLATLVIDGAGDAIAVIDGGAMDFDPATAHVYDATTLAGPTTIELPTGSAVGFVGDDLVVPLDRTTDQTLDGDVVFDFPVSDTAGSFAFGLNGEDRVLMNEAGRTLGSIGSGVAGFVTDTEVSENGTAAAILTADEIVVVRIP